MSQRKIKETLIFIINIGTTIHNAPCNSSLLNKSQIIAKHLIERKIFFRPKDKIGLVLMGSNVTKNELQFPNVEEVNNLIEPNWDLIEIINNLKGTSCSYDWVTALYVAVDYFKRESTDFNKRTILLLSEFKEEEDIISQYDTNKIAETLKEENIYFSAIGLAVLDEKSRNSLTYSEKLLESVCEKVNGQYLTFDDAIADVRFYKETQPICTPWTCTLEILDLKIPIKSYVKTTCTSKLPKWNLVNDEESQSADMQPKNPVKVIRVTQYLDRHREAYKSEDTIFGYMFGGTFIPFNKEDEEAMIYRSGSKCFKFCKFAKRESISIDSWYSSSSTRIVVPAGESVAGSFYSLVQAMNNQNVVAIVRKVSGNNQAPRMVALFPRINIEDEPWCLVEIQLPFAEDRRVVESKPLISSMKHLSKEQDKAVDDLLNSFTLPENQCTSIVEGAAAFLPGCVSNPAIHHTWDMLSYRAINPEEPLPQMRDNLKSLLETPMHMKEHTEHSLQQVWNTFDLANNKEPEPGKSKDNVEEKSKEMNNSQIVPDNSNTIKDDDFSKESILALDTCDLDLDELVRCV